MGLNTALGSVEEKCSHWANTAVWKMALNGHLSETCGSKTTDLNYAIETTHDKDALRDFASACCSKGNAWYSSFPGCSSSASGSKKNGSDISEGKASSSGLCRDDSKFQAKVEVNMGKFGALMQADLQQELKAEGAVSLWQPTDD